VFILVLYKFNLFQLNRVFSLKTYATVPYDVFLQVDWRSVQFNN